MNLKDKTCCFTGHRDIPNSILPQLRSQINEVVTALIESGICFFGAGGAIGFDTLAAEAVLNLREKYPHVKLILVLPCPEQAGRWSREAKLRYEQIKKSADKIVYTSERYTSDSMFRRNRHLVDGSSICISYCTRNAGGTAYTVRYAQQCGLRVISLSNFIL